MKRTGIKPGRRRRVERERMNPELATEVFMRQSGVCACGCGRPIAPFPLGYHHVFPKGRWPGLVNEVDNWLGVAADCHANHETGMTRLPRAACARAERLAATPPMENYLDNTYGPKEV